MCVVERVFSLPVYLLTLCPHLLWLCLRCSFIRADSPFACNQQGGSSSKQQGGAGGSGASGPLATSKQQQQQEVVLYMGVIDFLQV